MGVNTLDMAEYIYGLVHEKKMIQEDLRILQQAPDGAKLSICGHELRDPTLKVALENMLINQINAIIGQLDALEIKKKQE